MERSKCKIQTNWYVLTGGPCTGKTTMVNMLATQGYKTTIEHARHYIDSQRENGENVEEIRANKKKFQEGVLDMQIKEEMGLNPQDTIFLDRAIPDAMAYYQFLNLEYDKKLLDAMELFCYKKIFILDRLPLVNDYARREDTEEQTRIHNLIIKVYKSLLCPTVFVPVLSPVERMNFIIDNIN